MTVVIDFAQMAPSNAEDSVVAVSPETGFHTAKRAGKETFHDASTTTSDFEWTREAALTALTVEEEKKLLRKVDWRLIPMLCMLYLVKKLDESNVSNPFRLN